MVLTLVLVKADPGEGWCDEGLHVSLELKISGKSDVLLFELMSLANLKVSISCRPLQHLVNVAEAIQGSRPGNISLFSLKIAGDAESNVVVQKTRSRLKKGTPMLNYKSYKN